VLELQNGPASAHFPYPMLGLLRRSWRAGEAPIHEQAATT
jgi:hypothetical protein